MIGQSTIKRACLEPTGSASSHYLHLKSVWKSVVAAHMVPKAQEKAPSPAETSGGYLAIFIASGTGELRIGKDTWRVGGGDLIIFELRQPYRLTADGKDRWEEYGAHFSGIDAKKWYAELCGAGDPPVRGRGSLLMPFWMLWELAERENNGAHERITSLLRYLMVEVAASLTAPAEQGLAAISDVYVTRALTLLGDRLDKDIRCEDIAEALAVGERWLRREIKRAVGVGPVQYRLRLRIAQAQRLLSDSQLGVGEIAGHVGFTDVHHFGRLFRRKVGCSPSQWRDQTAKPLSRASDSSKASAGPQSVELPDAEAFAPARLRQA